MSSVMMLKIGDADLKNLQPTQMRVAFLMRLPFRIRIGRFYRVENEAFNICFHNPVAVEEPNPPLEYFRNNETYWSVAVVETKEVSFTKADANLLHTFEWNQDPNTSDALPCPIGLFLTTPPVDIIKRISISSENIASSLNRVLAAYYYASEAKFPFPGLRTVTASEVSQCSSVKLLLLYPGEASLSEEEMHFLCEYASRGSISRIIGSPHTLSEEQLTRIPEILANQRRFIHTEFEFEAARYNSEGNHRLALLMMVVALEAVHGTFVRRKLMEYLHAYKPPNQKTTDLIDTFIRDVGMTVLCQVSPYLWLQEDERPTQDELHKCVEGISLRNAIMHALPSSKTDYKVFEHNDTKLIGAYKGVQAVYQRFKNALESMRAT